MLVVDNRYKNKMSLVKNITDADFVSEVLGSNLPVLVDFWAPWCGPCKSVLPILDEISLELDGSLKIVKINVDEDNEAAQAYSVMSVPTLILFKEKKELTRIIGAKTKDQLLALISSTLK